MSKTGGDDNEPKENDKCITPPTTGTGAGDNGVGHAVEPEFTKKTKRNAFLESVDSAKNVINERYKLIIAILSVLIFILLLIVIVLAVSLGSATKVQDICVTSACLSAASNIVRSLNASADPCNDFWSFSCGGWIDSNPLMDNKGAYSVRDQLEDHIFHDVRHFIDLLRKETDDSSPSYKVKVLYQTCMAEEDSDNVVFTNVITTEFGGWSLHKPFSHAKFNFDLVLEKLHSQFGVDALFSVRVGVDDQSSSANIIKIAPAGLGLPHRDFYLEDKYSKYVAAYKQLIIDVAMKLGKSSSTDVEKYANAVVEYEKRIARFTPSIERMQSPSSFQNKRLSDLKQEASRIKWKEFLQKVYPHGNIKDLTIVRVQFLEYFKEVSHMVTTSDNVGLSDYLVWRYIFTNLPYAPGELNSMYNIFLQTMEGAANPHSKIEERWKFCIRTTLSFLAEPVAAVYYKEKKKMEDAAEQDIQQMIDVIISTLKEKVDSFSWIRGDKDLNVIRTKIEELSPSSSIGVGHPREIDDMSKLSRSYNGYVLTRNFLNNIFDGYRFKRSVEERRLINPSGSVNLNWNIKPTDTTAQYEYAGNQLTVGMGLFQYPFYERSLPIAMKFGALGFQIGSAIMNFVNSKGIYYNPKGEIPPIDENSMLDTQLAQNSTEQCLINDIIDHPPIDTSFIVNPNLTAPQTFADVGGLQLIYESYKKYLSKFAEGGIIPGLSRSNDQLFFISMAQSMCESVRPSHALATYSYRKTLPAKQRINEMFRQVKQFQSSFSCDKHSKMCRVF